MSSQTQTGRNLRPSDLAPGESARIVGFSGGCADLEQRLTEMGLIVGEEITLLRFAPLGDPIELQVRDTRFILRQQEATSIQLQVI